MQSTDDSTLLRQYLEDHSDVAFAALVTRHVNLVYSVALRHVGDPHLAEEITQAVFILLAKKAALLRHDKALSSWLFQVTRLTASNFVRSETRRHRREQEAHMQSVLDESGDEVWRQISPLLDTAVASLSEADRQAIVLRFYEGRNLREVGAVLGASEDAAEKRVSRAVERLREFFAKRGITVGASGLVAFISANAVQAAPVGLAVTISTAAALAGTTITTTATATATKAIAMTTFQKTMIGATLAAAFGTGIYEARQASTLRTEVETLRQQQAPLANQIQQLTLERDDATGQLAALRNDNERLKRDTTDLPKLRGDATRLRQSQQELAQMKTADAQKRNDPIESQTKSLLARVNQLKQQLDQTPDKKIPELQFVTDKDWLIAVTKNPGETDVDARKALVTLRNHGKLAFAPMLRGALQAYISANNGLLPADISQLRAYFQSPVEDAMLQRYQLLHTGKLSDVSPEDWLVAEKAPVDTEYDSRLRINNTSISMVGIDAYAKQP